MQKWEYLRLSVVYDIRGDVETVKMNGEEVFNARKENRETQFDLPDYLMKAGRNRWEMVNVFISPDGWTEIYHFKRPVE